MRLLDLLRGTAAGYGLKAIQTLAALWILPLIVSDEVLGLAGYGRAFALITASAVASVFTDGFKVALSRAIAAGITGGGDTGGRMLGAGTRLLGLAAIVFAVTLFSLRDPLLHLLGLPVDSEHRAAFAAACVMLVVAEVSHGLLALLLARGRLDVVNGIQALEVVGRSAFFLVYYRSHDATVANFVAAFACGALLRSCAFATYAMVRFRGDLASALHGRLRDARPMLRYSVSISLSTLYYHLFFRLSVPFVSAVLGGSAAGALALTLNISDTYLRGALLAVVEPVIVPLAARFRIEDVRGRLRAAICRTESLFRATCLIATAPLAAATPFAIEAWLGPNVSTAALPCQVMVAAIGIQMSLALKRSLSIGLGEAGVLARVSTRIGLAAIVAIAIAAFHLRSFEGVAFSIAAFSALSEIFGATRGFAAVLDDERERTALPTLALAVAGYAPAIALGIAAGPHGLVAVAGVTIASAAWSVLLAHLFVVSVPAAWATIQQLQRNAGRDLFGAR